jgi:hypothetical protein
MFFLGSDPDLELDPDWAKMPDPDQVQVNPDTYPWFKYR